MRPRLNDRQKGLLVAIIEAERRAPPERRGLETLVIEMAGRSAAPNRGIFPAVNVWPEDLWRLELDGLLRVWRPSEYGIGYQVLPAAEDEYELIQEERGQPTPELRAVRRGERLDRRYRTFAARVANLVAVLIFVLLVGLGAIAVLETWLAGVPFALLALAITWTTVSTGIGRGPREVALAARDRIARPIIWMARRLVEGRDRP